MYNHAPDNYICPFCLLVQGTENKHVHSVQSDIIYHDNAVTAFIGSHHCDNVRRWAQSILQTLRATGNHTVGQPSNSASDS